MGIMRAMLRFAVAACCVVFCLPGAQKPATPGYDRSQDWLLLYAWEAPAGGWNFSLFWGPPCGDCNAVEDITQGKRIIRGLDQLKFQISKLLPGLTITFAGKAAHGKGVERLKYPPATIMDEITRYAKTRGLKVSNPWQEYYEVPEWWELYAWQSSDGDWNFSLFPAWVNRAPLLEMITDKNQTIRGVEALESRLSHCRPKSKIILAGGAGVVGAHGAERLKFPPDNILNELKRYAQAHNLQIDDPRRR